VKRFVRIYHHEKDDPGSRLRVDYDPDDTGAFVVADENVQPEKTFDPNCYRVQTLANVELDRHSARWLRDALIALCEHLDVEEAARGAS
jgi:hypothetical protein